MLYFNVRKKLDDKFKDWVKKESVADCSLNTISFLVANNLLDESKVEEFLRGDEGNE